MVPVNRVLKNISCSYDDVMQYLYIDLMNEKCYNSWVGLVG